MKTSAIRMLFAFVAGAGCAAMAAGIYPREPITIEEFQERATVLIAEVEALGGYVGSIDDSRVGLFTDPIACVPNPPVPKLPVNAVDPRTLRRALGALEALNEAYILGEPVPVYELAKCKPRQ